MSTLKVNRFENTDGVAFGCVLQTVNVQSGAVATSTVTIPNDDTIPQNTEGTELLTLAITPKSATNKLKISVVLHVSANGTQYCAAALFQDSTANALAAADTTVSSSSYSYPIVFTHYMTAGTTSTTTFKVRAGTTTAGTLTFNGRGGTRVYGGVYASSITIEEIQV